LEEYRNKIVGIDGRIVELNKRAAIVYGIGGVKSAIED
jgi:chorismate mutase